MRAALVSILVSLVAVGCRTVAPVPDTPLPDYPAPPPEAVPKPPPVPAPTAPKPQRPQRTAPAVFENRAWYPAADLYVWELATGARLAFRPLRTTPRRVALYAFAPGGLAAVEEGLSASIPLRGQADGPVAVRVEERDVVLVGEAATGELNALLRAAGEAITQPRPSRAPSPPEAVLESALVGITRAAPPSAADEAVYARLVGDPRRYTFVLVGDATADLVEAEAARVLPWLRPDRDALLASLDSEPAPPRAPSRPEVVSMGGEAEGLAVAFRGRVEGSYRTLAGLDVLAALLHEALGERARVTADLLFGASIGEVRVVIDGVDGVEAESDMLDAVRAVVASPPSERALTEARAHARRAHDEALATPEGWHRWIARLLRYDHDASEIEDHRRQIGLVTAERVHALARSVLGGGYVLVRG